MANPVTHFEILGTDAGPLHRFYGETFGWQMQEVMDGAYYMVNTGVENAIPGGVGAAQPGGPSRVTFYIEVEDPAATLAKIAALGGQTVQEPMDVPGGPTIALFSDPQGNVVGLVKERAPEAS